jgi:hypothetical protein
MSSPTGREQPHPELSEKIRGVRKKMYDGRRQTPLLLVELDSAWRPQTGGITVRLTLRTLLAYLDDTLEPAKAKAIGQKIAESPTAQELINRIREVVRRRRLTVPPANGPAAKLDPNTIAEYIDSVLPADQLAEVEEICLGSDLYLAEIAACHQILTVVLSEPSLVPPTARQRMYGIVKGPEAVPHRRAGQATGHDAVPAGASAGRDDADETLLLGLPFFSGHGSWQRVLIPAAILLLLGVGIGLAIWKVLPPSHDQQLAQADHQTQNSDTKPPEKPDVKTPDAKDVKPVTDKPPEKPDVKTPEKPADKPESKPSETRPAPAPPKPEDKPANNTEPPPAGNRVVPPVRPAVQGERKVVGKYQSPANTDPSVLLAWSDEKTGWHRLFHGNPVASEDPLVSLPGYHSTVAVSGVEVVLAGDLNDQMPVVILESAAVLHANAEVDLDLTLDRGRITLVNRKPEGTAKVLLRFDDITWFLTLLEPGTRVTATLGSLPKVAFSKDPDKLDIPLHALALKVVKGQAYVKGGLVQHLAREKGPGYYWDNIDNVPEPREHALPLWFQEVPARSRERDWTPALAGLSQSLKNARDTVDVVLSEKLKDPEPLTRILSVFCLGATSDLPALLEALADERQVEVRVAAINVLRHWISLRSENEQKLYQALTKKYKSATAEIIMILLHNYSAASLRRPETYEQLIEWLKSDKLPIRQLAHWQLYQLPATHDIAVRIPYDPAEGIEQREAAYQLWRRAVPNGKLPSTTPPPDTKPPTRKPGK